MTKDELYTLCKERGNVYCIEKNGRNLVVHHIPAVLNFRSSNFIEPEELSLLHKAISR